MTYEPDAKMRAWCHANNYDCDLHLDLFNDYLANKTGKPYKDLPAAFRNCCRADWGGVRRQALINKKYEPAKPQTSWRDSWDGIKAKAIQVGANIEGLSRIDACIEIDSQIGLNNVNKITKGVAL